MLLLAIIIMSQQNLVISFIMLQKETLINHWCCACMDSQRCQLLLCKFLAYLVLFGHYSVMHYCNLYSVLRLKWGWSNFSFNLILFSFGLVGDFSWKSLAMITMLLLLIWGTYMDNIMLDFGCSLCCRNMLYHMILSILWIHL